MNSLGFSLCSSAKQSRSARPPADVSTEATTTGFLCGLSRKPANSPWRTIGGKANERSFANMTNRSGPNTHPWGHPLNRPQRQKNCFLSLLVRSNQTDSGESAPHFDWGGGAGHTGHTLIIYDFFGAQCTFVIFLRLSVFFRLGRGGAAPVPIFLGGRPPPLPPCADAPEIAAEQQ